MGPSLQGQNAFFRNLGDGSSSLIVHVHQTRPSTVCDPQIPALQTVAEITAFIDSEGASGLQDVNLSVRPDESLPIRLSDPASAYPSASPVGLTIDEYMSALSQPLPLGGLDAPDRTLRETQAAWVAGFEAEFSRVTQSIYDGNRRTQGRMAGIGAATAVLAVLPALGAPFTGPGCALGLGTVAGLCGIGTMVTLVRLDGHARHLRLERFHAAVRAQAAAIEALTRRRQDNLVALIDGLFAAAGHLRDDHGERDLPRLMNGHVRMIFALRTLLSGNRKCTRYHVRMLEMRREATALRLRDEALTRRQRHAGGYINQSTPRVHGRLWALVLAGMPMLLVSAALIATPCRFAGAWLLPPSWLTGIATLVGATGLVCAWTAITQLNAGIDVLLSSSDLAGLCDENGFDQMPGPADVPLEDGFLRMIERLLKRLVREEDKHH